MRTFSVAALLFVTISAAVTAQEWEPRRDRRYGAQIRIGKSYHLPADQAVTWPLVVVGGSATLDGRADDDVVVVGGSVRVGPTARIRGDLTVIGGEIILADTADVTGEIHEIALSWPDLRFAGPGWLWPDDMRFWALFGLAGSLLRLTIIAIATMLITLVAPARIRRVELRVSNAAAASGAIGLLVQVLAVPILVVAVAGLIVSIVGIPLLILVPFVILAVGVIWVAGFAAVATQLGGRARGRVPGAMPSPIDTLLGLALIASLSLIGHVVSVGPGLLSPIAAAFITAGFIIEYLAWTVGLGAALAAPILNGGRKTPPPVPSHVPAPVSF
jgi:hypothetical protein